MLEARLTEHNTGYSMLEVSTETLDYLEIAVVRVGVCTGWRSGRQSLLMPMAVNLNFRCSAKTL